MAVLTAQQQQDRAKRFFNPDNDFAPTDPTQTSAPPVMTPAPAAAQGSNTPNMQPPAATTAANSGQNLQPNAATPPQGNNDSNYLFKTDANAFMPARPVGALDNVHGVRRGLALALAGLANFGAGLNHREDPTLQNWTNQELAERQYDAAAPNMRAKAGMEANQADLANAERAAQTRLTNVQADVTGQNIPLQEQAEKEYNDLVAHWQNRDVPDWDAYANSKLQAMPPAISRRITPLLQSIKQLPQTGKGYTLEMQDDLPKGINVYGKVYDRNDPELAKLPIGAAAAADFDRAMQAHSTKRNEHMQDVKTEAGIQANAQARTFAEQDSRQQKQFDQQNEQRRREDVTKDELALNSENQQYKSASGLLKQAMDPKNPNSAAATAALFKAIGVDLPEGVHRMTDTELSRVGNLGSAGQKLAGMLKGWSTGVPFTNEIGNQMQAVIDEVHNNKVAEHQANIDTINRNYGYTPPAQQTTPQTHKFSQSAWQKANPGKDVNAAVAAAKQQGFEVVP